MSIAGSATPRGLELWSLIWVLLQDCRECGSRTPVDKRRVAGTSVPISWLRCGGNDGRLSLGRWSCDLQYAAHDRDVGVADELVRALLQLHRPLGGAHRWDARLLVDARPG